MYNDSFITVYLNGFTLPNDRLALREIARQLSLEHELEGKVYVCMRAMLQIKILMIMKLKIP